MEKFKKLNSENLPTSYMLVCIKRKDDIYLGFREDKPFSENPDNSRDCYWHGNPRHSMLLAEKTGLAFRNMFSDITVESWAEIEIPSN